MAPKHCKGFGAIDGTKTLKKDIVWSHGWPQSPINLKGLEPWMAPKPYKFIRFGAIDGRKTT